MNNWTDREHRETKNVNRSLAGKACEKWPLGKLEKQTRVNQFSTTILLS
jgi:hypothetical protein